MTEHTANDPLHAGDDELPELELTDEDILDAMRHIPGYLDITTSDFRILYHLAHSHAVDRLFNQVKASQLMLSNIQALRPDMRLDQAARLLVAQKRKSLPVVDDDNRVIGVLTESDFLRRLKADSFLQLMLKLLAEPSAFTHRCHETPVSEAMTTPALTIPRQAGFRAIVGVFHAHEGRATPVVDEQGRLVGLLLRKDFIRAHHLEDLL
jgi:CBS-domain-containing membrane protein